MAKSSLLSLRTLGGEHSPLGQRKRLVESLARTAARRPFPRVKPVAPGKEPSLQEVTNKGRCCEALYCEEEDKWEGSSAPVLMEWWASRRQASVRVDQW